MCVNYARAVTSPLESHHVHGGGPGFEDFVDNRLQAYAVGGLSEDEGTVPAHGARIAFHDRKARANMGCEVDLIDHEQIGLCDPGAPLAGHLVTAGDVDHVDCVVCQFSTE